MSAPLFGVASASWPLESSVLVATAGSPSAKTTPRTRKVNYHHSAIDMFRKQALELAFTNDRENMNIAAVHDALGR